MTRLPSDFAKCNQLSPLDELGQNDLQLLLEQSEVQQLEPRTLVTAERGQLVYLLEGEVSLLSGGFVTESFTHLDQRALTPLFNEALDEDSAVLTSHGWILLVDRGLFDGLYFQAQAARVETSELDLSKAENELFQHLLRAFNNNKLDLPALPEAAFKIRQAINNPEVGSTEIIQIVQTDPVLSARLVKVANSPLYGTWREIKTVRDAVRRLGLETTKNLSFSLSVRQLFKAKTSLIKQQIQKIYQESTAVAAIAYVVTQSQAKHLDPEQALLSGLVQNLGLIPILKYIDEHPSMMVSIDQLGKSIKNLYVPVSTLILNEWNFDPEFIDIVENNENWERDTKQETDYTDIIIASKLIYQQEHLQDDGLPHERIDDLPVMRKLGLHEFDDEGHFFMDKAQIEIAEMQKLLHTT
ncbi:MAG: HDOD domain-containing protein [Gammaproteobacteria bacterium]|nr:HDOD domain-containing protein [Gammaproteobacteria bacterium]